MQPRSKIPSYFSQIQQKYTGDKKISFKIVVIGQSFVGKTSLIQKFTTQNFSTQYTVTVGVDFSCRSAILEDTKVQLQIWDTCGHDMFRSVTSSFYRGACGVFLVFALNSRKSFEKLQFWYDEFIEYGSTHAMIILIGTKSDKQHDVSADQGMQMMKKLGGVFYVQTSAQTGQQIEQLFQKTSQIMYMKYKVSHEFRVLAQPRKHNKSSILINDNQNNSNENQDASTSRIRNKCC